MQPPSIDSNIYKANTTQPAADCSERENIQMCRQENETPLCFLRAAFERWKENTETEGPDADLKLYT